MVLYKHFNLFKTVVFDSLSNYFRKVGVPFSWRSSLKVFGWATGKGRRGEYGAGSFLNFLRGLQGGTIFLG